MTRGHTPLAPGATIGILGGGQLGRLLALSAAKLGLHTHIFAPEADACAFEVARHFTCQDYADTDAVKAFAHSVDVITYEFENVPVATAQMLLAECPVYPPPSALSIAQDRRKEKKFLNALGLAVAPFRAVETAQEMKDAVADIGLPCILKTAQFGYDGKGQIRIDTDADAAAAFENLNVPCVLESVISLAQEISVIAARARDGSVAIYDVTENVHRSHILHTSSVPAKITPALDAAAKEAAQVIITALGYVGVMACEFFVDDNGELLINEIAPRVHNSGHWTLDACACSQFENHIRAVAGWPLGPTARVADAVMTNLIGSEAENWRKALSQSDILWLYGKGEARIGRKMGHFTRLTPRQ